MGPRCLYAFELRIQHCGVASGIPLPVKILPPSAPGHFRDCNQNLCASLLRSRHLNLSAVVTTKRPTNQSRASAGQDGGRKIFGVCLYDDGPPYLMGDLAKFPVGSITIAVPAGVASRPPVPRESKLRVRN